MSKTRLERTRMERVSQELQRYDGVEAEVSPIMPLVFTCIEEEATMIIMKHMLSFGSGFASLLKRDPEETLILGLMHIHISSKRLDTEFFASINAMSISLHFGFEIGIDKEIMGGVYQQVDGPLKPFANQLVEIMRSTGEELRDLGCDHAGEYLWKCNPRSAPEMVDWLCTTFSGFRKSSNKRKAIRCVRALHKRFVNDEHLCFDMLDQMPVAVDDVIMSQLHSAGLMSTLPDKELELPDDVAIERELVDSAVGITRELMLRGNTTALIVEAFLGTSYPATKHLIVHNSLDY